jgi:hypothetical protein
MGSAICVINPGQKMPLAYAKEMLEYFNAGGAFIIPDPKEGLDADQFTKEFMAGAITATDEKFGDRFRAYFVTDEEMMEEDLQPFPVVTDANDKPLVYAFVEGKFEKYDEEDPEMGPEAAFVAKWLGDKITGYWSSCNNSVKKLFTLLDTASFRKECQEAMGSRSVCVLINNEDAPLWISKNNADDSGKFPWGEVSQKLTYEEKPATVDFSKMSYSEKKAFKKANPNYVPGSTASAAPAKAPDAKPSDKDPKDNKPSVPIVPEGVSLEKITDMGSIGVKNGKRFLFPPLNLNDEELKKFYPKHGGGKASDWDWKNRVGIPIDRIQKNSHFFAMVHGPASKDTDPHGGITRPDRQILTGPEIGEALAIINGSKSYPNLEALLATVTETHPLFSHRVNKKLEEFAKLLTMTAGERAKLSHKVLCEIVHELSIAYLKANPAAFGEQQVTSPEPAKAPAAAPAEPAKPADVKPDLSKMSYSEKKKYRKEHPEAASAA